MTDAERISEHIRAITYQTWDAKAIEDMLADLSAYVPGSYMDQVKRLAAMLENVRREEREACASVAEDPRFMNAPAWERQSLIAYWIRERGSK